MVCLVFPGALTFMTSANVPLAYVGCWHIILSSTLHGATLAGGEHFFQSRVHPTRHQFCVDTPTLGICPVGGKRTLAFLSSLSFFSSTSIFFFFPPILSARNPVSCNNTMALYLAHTLWLFCSVLCLFHCICIRDVVAYRAMEQSVSRIRDVPDTRLC